jgi:hypothetical protein
MKKVLFCIGLLIASSNVSFAGGFTVTRTEIKQGANVIATYTRHETRVDDNVTMEMVFKAGNGSTIATATIPYQRNEVTTIVTNDGKSHTLTLAGQTDIEMAEQIANLLSDQKYL